MSATNRGTKRIEYDFYPTPIEVIHNFLDHYQLKDGTILECAAGNGNFIQAIRDKGYKNIIVANEIRQEERRNLINSGADFVYHKDFLVDKLPDHDIKTIITNPPFSKAKEFILRCKELYPDAEIIMLLRLAFLESRTRYEFWQKYKVNKLYILSKRPSFANGKTDATAYAWFVFDGSDTQEIKVI